MEWKKKRTKARANTKRGKCIEWTKQSCHFVAFSFWLAALWNRSLNCKKLFLSPKPSSIWCNEMLLILFIHSLLLLLFGFVYYFFLVRIMCVCASSFSLFSFLVFLSLSWFYRIGWLNRKAIVLESVEATSQR